MITVTTNEVPNKNITDVKGMVQGSTVQSKHVGRDIGAGLKTLVGGEIEGYADLMKNARDIALDRMIKEAESLQANAIVGMRYQTSQVMNSAAEVIAYGTAVVVE
ncbi:YbjQ family protein [Virgibacillus sp. NKC19-3]|uniref:YbjQ family protein n=1 Tax=Virgibacillus saliphilus TaxID=2831674 RepID=UPI001C9A8954|nr:YbjQ family protein [Virgibacillus sp. NKC19-3]MBY7142370.1 YbjQ family protein [Virgibacillus sp. NKC19-3]